MLEFRPRNGVTDMVWPRLSMASLDLRPLYFYVQVVEYGSFSKAASALSIAQPALSRFIKRLEDDLRVQLLYRNGRGVQMTEAGERLLEHAKGILRGLSQAQTEIIALRGAPIGTVALAVPPMMGDALTIGLVKKFRSDYPMVALSLREGFAADALEWLANGLADVAVLYNPPNITTLLTEHILDDRLYLVGTPGSLELLPGSDLPCRRLAELPLILAPQPHRLRAIVENAAQQAGVPLCVEVEVSGINTLMELVRGRIGYTVLPFSLVREDMRCGRLSAWPIVEPRIEPRLFVATSMQRPQTLATKSILRAIHEQFALARGEAR